MNMKTISKAIAAAAAGAAAATGTTLVVVPPDVAMPWFGYLAVGLVNAAIGFLVVYAAPKNR